MFTFQTAKFPKVARIFFWARFFEFCGLKFGHLATVPHPDHLEDSLCIVVIKLVPGEDLLPGLGVLEELGLVIGHFLGQYVSIIFKYFLSFLF
jgi:hypothetical protein